MLLAFQEYLGEESNQEVCVYHAGVPVFHEGFVSIIHLYRLHNFLLI